MCGCVRRVDDGSTPSCYETFNVDGVLIWGSVGMYRGVRRRYSAAKPDLIIHSGGPESRDQEKNDRKVKVAPLSPHM